MIATSFALICFAAACLLGAAAGNSLNLILLRAATVLVSCWIVGWIVGAIAQQTIQAHLADYRSRHPIPSDAVEASSTAEGQAESLAPPPGP